jgi:AraC-like DNA-binding protein
MLSFSIVNNIDILDLIYFATIAILSISILILIKLDGLFERPKFYLKIVLILAFMVLVNDLLIQKLSGWTVYLLPVSYFIYFIIYPLVYVYTRDLIFHGEQKKRASFLVYLIVPFLVLIGISIIYYPLSYQEKLKFVSYHISQSSHNSTEFAAFQYIVVPAYYIQTITILFLSFLLVRDLNKSTNVNSSDLLISKYVLIYIAGVLFFEIAIVISTLIIEDISLRRIIELLLISIFILFGLYIGFNQAFILIQARLIKHSAKIMDLGESHSPVLKLTGTELVEVKELIEVYLNSSRAYLDPNLTLESFSKRIHIQSRKISLVINRLFNKNFHHFINEFRIQEAVKLMNVDKEIVIEELYTKVGFNSRSTFNRVFKEIFGKSPSEYLDDRRSA